MAHQSGEAFDGKPCARNPHVRFDEGEVAPAATPRRGSLLYNAYSLLRARGPFLCMAALGVLAVPAATEMKATAEGIVVNVDPGQTATWASLFPASGLTAQDCAGKLLVKTGAGTFDPDGDAIRVAGISGVEIREGLYVATVDAELGAEKGAVTVKSGATLVLDRENDVNVKSRTLTVEGHGSSPECPAVRIVGGGWNKLDTVSWVLSGDASVYLTAGEVWPLRYSEVTMNGHALTLSGAKYTFRNGGRWRGAGRVNVGEGAKLETWPKEGWWDFASVDGTRPVFSFAAGATFMPKSADVFDFVKKFEFAHTATLAPQSEGTACAIDELTGTPSVTANAALLTVGRKLAVPATDVLSGLALTVAGRLSFPDGCVLEIAGFSRDLIRLPSGEARTVATAEEIVGTPALSGFAAAYFTLTNTGMTLALTRKHHAGPIVFMGEDWGVTPGEESAAANAAAVAARLAGLADHSIVLIEPGEYWFGESLDLSELTARGVAFRSEDHENPAVLRSGVRVGAAREVEIASVVIAGTAGPAVVANGTQGLTVRDCRLENVAGAWSDGKSYPLAFADVADLLVVGGVHSFAASPAWAGQAFLAGGSQQAASEVQAGGFVVSAAPGETKTWAQAVAASGLADAAFRGKRLVKVGAGEFYPKGEGAAMQAAGVSNVLVRAGRYAARADAELGAAKGGVTVESGATLVLTGGSKNLISRTVEVAGSGTSPEYPAVRTESAYRDLVDEANWRLAADAAFYNASTGTGDYSAALFNYSTVRANGHVLTLNGVAGSVYRVRNGLFWHDGGGLVVGTGVRLQADKDAGAGNWWQYALKGGSAPELVVRDGAALVPETADAFKLFTRLSFEGSSALNPMSGMGIVLDALTGVPTLSADVQALTVNVSYALRAADVAADRYLDCPGALTFGKSAVIDVDVPDGIGGKVAFRAQGGVSGRPKASDGIRAAGLRVAPRDAQSWAFTGRGFLLVVR